MSQGAGNTSPLQEEPLRAAAADLEKVRGTLEAAARGDASPQAVKDAVTQYLADHHSAIRESAAAVAEEARLQTLAELYRWRAQLNVQLGSTGRVEREPGP